MMISISELRLAVERDDVEKVEEYVKAGVDVNARLYNEEDLKTAHNRLLESVTADQLHEIVRIPVDYDVVMIIIYAVCLITFNDFVKPHMTYDQVWKLAKDEVFQSLSQCLSFLQDISSVKPLTGHKLTRLQLLIKENGILSIPNARFASKVFAALLEWVLGVFSVSCCKSVVHHAKSSQMVKVLASRGDLVADVCDEKGYSRLAKACKNGELDIVHALLANGASPIQPVQNFVDLNAIEDTEVDDLSAAAPQMPMKTFQQMNACRKILGLSERLRIVPSMLQYTVNSHSYAPPLEFCTHEDAMCNCGDVPPPACVLVLSALFFLLSVEIALNDEDNVGFKILPGIGRIYVLSIKEVRSMISSNHRFFEMLRVRIHHFNVISLSSEDIVALQNFLEKYSYCFGALRSTNDESILEYICDLDADRGRKLIGEVKCDGVAARAAGDKREIFELFIDIACFIDLSINYRVGKGFQRPVFLTNSRDICEALLVHDDFRLDDYIDNHYFNGAPILHHAVLGGNIDIVSLLIELGANVNVRNFDEASTPLHFLMSKLSPIPDRDSCGYKPSFHTDDSADYQNCDALGKSDLNYVPYAEDSLLLDLGSDCRMNTSLSHNPDCEIVKSKQNGDKINDNDHIDMQLGVSSTVHDEFTPEKGKLIVAPHVVIAHISRSEGLQRQMEISELRSLSEIDSSGEKKIEENLITLSEMLLQAGADISALDAFGYTPFSIIEHTHPDLHCHLQRISASSLSPILLALIGGIPDNQLLNIIEQHSDLVSQCTPQNKLPLHLALEYDRTCIVIKSLLKHHPDGATIPFNRMRRRKVSKIIDGESVLSDLITFEDQLPFFYAVEKKLSESILKILLEYSLPIDIFSDADEVADIYGYHYLAANSLMCRERNNCRFVWPWLLSFDESTSCNLHNQYQENNCLLSISLSSQLNLVSFIVDKYVRFIDGLVYCKNEEGKYAVAAATPQCRRLLLARLFFLGRYELFRGAPVHLSSRTLILLARDRSSDLISLYHNYSCNSIWHNGFGGNGSGRFVILKFMRHLDSWYREVSTRKFERIIDYADGIDAVTEHLKSTDIDDSDILDELSNNSNVNLDVNVNCKGEKKYDNLNMDPANWSTGLDEDGEGFRWYFNKMTYETWWHRPHCLGKLEDVEVIDNKEDIRSSNTIKKDSDASDSSHSTNNTKIDVNLSQTNNDTREDKFDETSKMKRPLNNNNIVSILHAMNKVSDSDYNVECQLKGFQDYVGLVIYPQLGKSLDDVLAHEKRIFSSPFMNINNAQQNDVAIDKKDAGADSQSYDWKFIVSVVKDVLHGLSYLHENDVIHGDIKPRNILRWRDKFCLIDFDRSSHITFAEHDLMRKHMHAVVQAADERIEQYTDSEGDGGQFTTFLPPELIHKNSVTMEPQIRLINPTRDGKCFDSAIKGRSIFPASFSSDIWCVGVLLYGLCTKSDLFISDKEGKLIDNENHEQLFSLLTWSQEVKWDKLARVQNQLARNFLWRLLHLNPQQRPTAREALNHPFLQERLEDTDGHAESPPYSLPAVARHIEKGRCSIGYMPPNVIAYDVFLSCGCDADAVHARVLYNDLISRGMKVFWHGNRFCNSKYNSTSVTITEDEDYCNNVSRCSTFMPLLSLRLLDCFSYEPASSGKKIKILKVKKDVEESPTSREIPWDNYIFGLRYASELKELGILRSITPILIGEKNEIDVLHEGSNNVGPTPGSRYLPHFLTSNMAIEEKTQLHLNMMNLGLPVKKNPTQIDIVKNIVVEHRAVELRGKIENAYQRVLEQIVKSFSSSVADHKFTASGREHRGHPGGRPGGSAGVRATIGALEERLKEQEIIIENHEIKIENLTAELQRQAEETNRLQTLQNNDFKEFNRMKAALEKAKLRILDLKLGVDKVEGSENDAAEESASNSSDYETDSNLEDDVTLS